MLMEKCVPRYEFVYFLSAFLSALFSCVEHNRLLSKDARFKDWFRDVKNGHLCNPDLLALREHRRKEVHFTGTETSQLVGMSFPEGLECTGSTVMEIDFSKGKPIGRYKTAQMQDLQEHQVEQKWVWETRGEPDVMELCGKGLDVVREIINSRDRMGFPD